MNDVTVVYIFEHLSLFFVIFHQSSPLDDTRTMIYSHDKLTVKCSGSEFVKNDHSSCDRAHSVNYPLFLSIFCATLCNICYKIIFRLNKE